MARQTVRDRLWLWGMKVNALQETAEYGGLRFPASTLTVEDAIRRTGIHNVIMAGNLPIDAASLRAMPSARRVVCKTSLHRQVDGQATIDREACEQVLLQAKQLAAADTRIDGFHLDDFSTGSISAGAAGDDLARLQFVNATVPPHLPLTATIYTMSLHRPELPALLPYFAGFVVPLWHADQIEGLPAAVRRLSELSGGKPMLLALYCYDFGNGDFISCELMQRHLETAERLILEGQVTGMCLCGTCMMDLFWESNRCFGEWVNRVGDQALPAEAR